MSSETPLIQVRGLRKNYPRQRVQAGLFARLIGMTWSWTGQLDEWEALNEGLPILRGVDLDVRRGETLAIVGPSGAGKSTLLHLLGALDRPSGGAIRYGKHDLDRMSGRALARWRNRHVGFVFQAYHLFPDLSALDNVLVPAMVGCGVFSYLRQRRALVERARELLTQVGLGDRMHHRPSQLSGGEQQRVAIARALHLGPELVLCDEPTGNLDLRTGRVVMEALLDLKRQEGQTYVIVTHDLRLAARADRVLKMVNGEMVGEIDVTAEQALLLDADEAEADPGKTGASVGEEADPGA